MDIRKLNPTSSAPADRTGESSDARRIQDARRAVEVRSSAARANEGDVLDTTHADRVGRLSDRVRASMNDRTERVRGREDDLRRRADDSDAIRRAARRVLALLDRGALEDRGDDRVERGDDRQADARRDDKSV